MTGRGLIAAAALLLALLAAGGAVSRAGYDRVPIDAGPEAVRRGRAVFMANCVACHGLVYLWDREHTEGIRPLMDPATARETFGVEPPDLSLMALARGKGTEGAEYIYRLLTSYYLTPAGEVRNRAFALWTESEGAIAMPPPIPFNDPELERKAADVAAFLLDTAAPEAPVRRRLGPFVLGYMLVMTALLFILNRTTWHGVKKGLDL
ncbi:MAG: cytochrome c1 [Thermodesulfobacteriota bacterium]